MRLIDGQLPLPPRYHTNPANPKDAGEETAEAAAEEAGRPLLRSDRRTCCIAHHLWSISAFLILIVSNFKLEQQSRFGSANGEVCARTTARASHID